MAFAPPHQCHKTKFVILEVLYGIAYVPVCMIHLSIRGVYCNYIFRTKVGRQPASVMHMRTIIDRLAKKKLALYPHTYIVQVQFSKSSRTALEAALNHVIFRLF